VAVAALIALSACTSDPAHQAAPTTTSADKRANLTVLKKADLPAGWDAVPAKSRLDGSPGKPIYCGVTAEPSPLREGRLGYYEEASTGRAVLEYGMVGTSASATEALDKLLKSVATCPDVRVVKQALDVGDQTVAWDTVSAEGARSRVMVFRAGDTVVAMIAFGTTSVPVNEQQAMAGTIASKLS
jgi:hypothetical protein